jgi:phospholipid/cholesterol/gamma-HCH transport system permease protein
LSQWTAFNVIPSYQLKISKRILTIELSGDWTLDAEFPEAIEDDIIARFMSGEFDSVIVKMNAVSSWNSALLTVIIRIKELSQAHHLHCNIAAVPEEMQRLLKLLDQIPVCQVDAFFEKNTSFLYNVGSNVIAAIKEIGQVIDFLGRAIAAFILVLKGKANYRGSDTWLVMQQTGAEALPIVSLLNFLVGAILGYIGALQLEKFGAEIFIGDMVGVAMTREIAAIITAIIMAGRSGAAFAAQIGTMKVNEEIDALRSMGLSPMEFLVLPRMIGMMLMMPLLAIYANFMGVFGGALVAYTILDITLEQYLDVVIKSVELNDLFVGITMSIVFGIIVSVVGCQKGMSCGSNAEAVGTSTTSAVVTSTVLIFVAAAFLTFFFGALGI